RGARLQGADMSVGEALDFVDGGELTVGEMEQAVAAGADPDATLRIGSKAGGLHAGPAGITRHGRPGISVPPDEAPALGGCPKSALGVFAYGQRRFEWQARFGSLEFQHPRAKAIQTAAASADPDVALAILGEVLDFLVRGGDVFDALMGVMEQASDGGADPQVSRA